MTTEGKDKKEISKNSNKKSSDVNYTVSEGSTVVLDAYEFISDKEISTVKDYSWEQTSGIPVIEVGNENAHSFSFTDSIR